MQFRTLKKKHGGGRYPRRKPCDKFDPPHRLQHRKNVNPKSKKAPRLDREALLAKGFAQPLKDDFDSKLHVEWFAGTNPRCALEVAGSVSHLAESAGCGALKRVSRSRAWLARTGTRGHGSKPVGKVDSVGEVEHLRAKLDFDPLSNGDVLEHRKVYIDEPRTIELIPGNVAARTSPYTCRAGCNRRREHTRRGKRSRVNPLLPWDRFVEIMRDALEGVADQIQTRADFVIRLSSVEFPHTAQLPAVHDVT